MHNDTTFSYIHACTCTLTDLHLEHVHDFHSAHVGNLTLVCLGPLTNVAMALHLDPKMGQKLEGCVFMGGNIAGYLTTGTLYNPYIQFYNNV